MVLAIGLVVDDAHRGGRESSSATSEERLAAAPPQRWSARGEIQRSPVIRDDADAGPRCTRRYGLPRGSPGKLFIEFSLQSARPAR